MNPDIRPTPSFALMSKLSTGGWVKGVGLMSEFFLGALVLGVGVK